jgi:hypothetical protein
MSGLDGNCTNDFAWVYWRWENDEAERYPLGYNAQDRRRLVIHAEHQER